MEIYINTDKKKVTVNNKELQLYSKESFEVLSQIWNVVGWNEKYAYTFTWQGRPIIQLPEDMIRTQEVIYDLKPDIIIETGVAHGGSLIYYASLCKMNGKGKVIGVDIEIRPHNRKAIEEHELFPYITLLEGSSTDNAIIEQIKAHVKPTDVVLVLLDSNHTKEHVEKELELYSQFVTLGSYIVSTDGIMKDLTNVPRGNQEWSWDNPYEAAKIFVEKNANNFLIQSPIWKFNESELTENITHWPGAWIKKIK